MDSWATPALGRAPRHRRGPGPKERQHWWRTRRRRSYTLHTVEALAEDQSRRSGGTSEDWAGVAALVEDLGRWTSRELAGGVMSRLWCGRSSDSDAQDLLYAGPVQHAGPHHSTALMEQEER